MDDPARADRILEGLRAPAGAPPPSPKELQRQAADAATRLSSGEAAPVLDRYEFHEVLGRGAAAVVYRATDRTLKRAVAVKVLHESFSRPGSVRERFEREASVGAGSAHPGIVAVHDFGEAGGKPYLVMELVDGRPLSDLLGVRPRDLNRLVSLLEEACRAMEVMHARGIVHRDLKPGNILVTASGHAKVSDFGIAHILGSEARLTQTGVVLGTPLYMAPEQIRSTEMGITPATDVYALGAILYEMITDRPPHLGESLTEIYNRILRDDPPVPLSLNSSVPAALQTICLKALDKEAGNRYRTAGELGEDLRRFLAGEPVVARPHGPAARAVRWIRRRPTLTVAAAAMIPLIVVLALVLLRWRDTAVERDRLAFARRQATLQEDGRRMLQEADLLRYRPELPPPGEVARIAGLALDKLREAQRADPENIALLLLTGTARELRDEDAAAVEAWTKVISRDPGNPVARFHLAWRLIVEAGVTMLARGDVGRPAAGPAEEPLFQEAAAQLNAIPADRIGELDDIRQSLVEVCRRFALKEQIRSFKAIFSTMIHYESTPGVEDLCWITNLSMESAFANANLDRALKVCPTCWLIHMTIGARRLAEGRVEEAFAAGERAVTSSPARPELRLLRARVQAARGKRREAIEDLDAALSSAPADWRLRTFAKDLREKLATAKDY